MHEFRVWAPLAESVEVELAATHERHAMQYDGGGWYTAELESAGAGTRYWFVVDGSEPMPDPRSPFQPEGVHGPSEVVDHDEFAWNDQHWTGIHLPAAVVYESHTGTFTNEGTFDAAIEKLDYLVSLGITAVELMPVAEFPGSRGWGYDCVDLYAPHHAYGGPDGLKRFVDACHERGLGVILDVVYNHVGPDGNYLNRFGPYFTDSYKTPWGDALNFDGPYGDAVRRFVIDNALMWLRDYHFDGLRLDAVHALVDMSATHILEELAKAVSELSAHVGRELFVIAENDLNDPKLVKSPEAGGFGIDAQWSDDFHHALHSALTGQTDGYYADYGATEDIAKALNDVFVNDGRYSHYRHQHYGRPVGELPRWRFLGYLQNHDQIGNRATGERSAALMSVGRLKIGAALVVLSPFVPMLFQGEEWAASTPFQYFIDHQNPELIQAVREGRRHEFAAFGWRPEDVPDPQDEKAFQVSKLNWAEREQAEHKEMLEWHRALITLRHSEEALTDGGADLEAIATGDVVSLTRGAIQVVANLGTSEHVQQVNEGSQTLLSSDPGTKIEGDKLTVSSDGIAVMRTG